MENSIIQELNAEADKIIGNKLLPAKSRQRYEHVYKLFIEWHNEKKCSSVSEEILIVYLIKKFVSLSSQIMPHFETQFVHETF